MPLFGQSKWTISSAFSECFLFNIFSYFSQANNIIKRDLAGAFVWSVEMDDFGDVCGDGKYPLLSTITKVLQPYKGIARIATADTEPKPKEQISQAANKQRPKMSTIENNGPKYNIVSAKPRKEEKRKIMKVTKAVNIKEI